ncbi:hypothetical protein QQF45_06190 [Halopseudomonas aestusnigri]|uniref:hypothetical protein n=1 Tax=Halopseudomonas aestusnigri TaxID=857252 RepID=UPI0025562C9E|nr:hypothetical protein [Halopseudomonas aestusnigri]MDL2198655.1 hypothetical protein [Halopseudomonas aestusnigri]
MTITAQEIVTAQNLRENLRPEGSFGKVIHYTISLHDEEADLGEEVAILLHQEISNFYSNSRVEIKTWPAPNHEFNIQLSVWAQ